jgi:hypothetical protein
LRRVSTREACPRVQLAEFPGEGGCVLDLLDYAERTRITGASSSPRTEGRPGAPPGPCCLSACQTWWIYTRKPRGARIFFYSSPSEQSGSI